MSNENHYSLLSSQYSLTQGGTFSKREPLEGYFFYGDKTMTRIQTVIFDFDSTLVTIEGIDYLAAITGTLDQVRTLTSLTMNGEMSFEAVYERRLNIVQPKQQHVLALANEYMNSVVKGAQETVLKLIAQGVDVHVISGGIEQAILPTTRWLGIEDDHVHAIALMTNSLPVYTHIAKNRLLIHQKGKALLIEDLALARRIVFVGDGSTDVETKSVVDEFVGFGGVVDRHYVRDHARYYIDSPTLVPVYNLLQTI